MRKQKTKFDVELDDEAMEILIAAAVSARCSARHLLNHVAKVALHRIKTGEHVVRPARQVRPKHYH